MKRQTIHEWAKRIDEWKASGVSAEEFARKLGVAKKTLEWWHWKLGGKRRSKNDLATVQPSTIDATPLTFIEMSSAPAIEVVLTNGIVVRIASHFDGELLARTLDVLERR
jgi:hypothetical protein